MDKLPPELLEHIMKLSSLDYPLYRHEPFPSSSSCHDFARYCRVSRLWAGIARRLLYCCPEIRNCSGTYTIHLTNFLRTLKSNTELASYVRGLRVYIWPHNWIYSPTRPKRASLSLWEMYHNSAESYVLEVLRACINLEHLHIQNGVFDLRDVLQAAGKSLPLRPPSVELALTYLIVTGKLRYLSFGLCYIFPTRNDHVTSQLELLMLWNRGDSSASLSTLSLPRLRHLHYLTSENSQEPFCHNFCQTLRHLRNLEILAFDTNLSAEFGVLLATIAQLDNLTISVRSWREGVILSMFEALSNTKILFLTLRDVRTIEEVASLLDEERPALRHLQSLQIGFTESSIWNPLLEDGTQTYQKMRLEETCESRGITLRTSLPILQCSFWEYAAPDFQYLL